MSAPFSVERARLLDRLVAGFREDAITDEDFDLAEIDGGEFMDEHGVMQRYDDPAEMPASLIEHKTGLCVWCDGRFDPNQLARGESRLHCSRRCADADLADITAEVLAEDAQARSAHGRAAA